MDYTAQKDGDTRTCYELSVKKEIKANTFDKQNVSTSFQNLQNTVIRAAKATLPTRKSMPIHKRKVSDHTKKLYASPVNQFEKMTPTEHKAADRAVRDSCRNYYRDYISGIVEDMEAADRV